MHDRHANSIRLVRGAVLAGIAILLVAGAVVLYVLATGSPPIPRSPAISEPIERHGEGDASVLADGAREASEERAAALLQVRRSGPGEETWNPQAGAVFDAIAAIDPPVTISERGCYVVGCGAVLTFGSENAYRRELAQLDGLAAYRAWTGGKQITSPDVRPDGRVVVALLLFRPD